MFWNSSNMFDILSTKLDVHSSIDLISEAQGTYKIMNELPSIWRLDPTEYVEKKYERWNLQDELFENQFSEINLLEDPNF